MRCILLLLLFPFQLLSQTYSQQEINRWEKQSKQVTIIRDNFGIPHIYGKTDADAVFGLLYAQCEDDFKRVEMNYIEKLGRLAEVNGEKDIYNDLMIRLVIDSNEAMADYDKVPEWLKKLLIAFADGINYYLYKNPQTKPVLLTRFEPWFPLLWTDGSIGAISTAGVSVAELKKFYTGDEFSQALPKQKDEEILTGSNGFAFSPKITASGNSILYINPHVTFYFRPEVHMVSEEGLNAYGAVTWGQFFIYQGFNEKLGWMHTSSAADISDAYTETISKATNGYTYLYNSNQKKVTNKQIAIKYKNGNELNKKNIDALFTHHGPIMAKRDGKWISVKANNRDMNGLIQSWQRTKAKSFNEFKKVMDLLVNTSNNTVYADGEGNIAYWHGNFIPVRDTSFDWSKPVDGSIAATEWKGLHPVKESVHIYNPENGWIQNCNSTPFTAAGSFSPDKKNYPTYMAPDGENFRGINAVDVLSKNKDYTIDKVIAAGYNTKLAAFEMLVPSLVIAFENNNQQNNSMNDLSKAIGVLKQWDYKTSEQSIATTLAIEWGQKILPSIYASPGSDQVEKTANFIFEASTEQLLDPMKEVLKELKNKYGKWEVAWGEINRFQRITGDVDLKYDDSQPSLPVGFASSAWGMLPSYSSRYFPGTKKRYGINGNSFVCAVEFGKKIKAKSLLAGGQSGDPKSPHFNDQAIMYTQGKFKDVLFYKDDIMKNAEKTYHPGN